MKWKKVSEHPLPEGDGKTLYIIKREGGSIDGLYLKPRSIPHKKYIVEWCEFNPDEIESADSKPIPPEFLPVDHHIHHSLEAESELSWEEKFRMQTQRKLLLKYLSLGFDGEESVIASAKVCKEFIAELKRGRE